MYKEYNSCLPGSSLRVPEQVNFFSFFYLLLDKSLYKHLNKSSVPKLCHKKKFKFFFFFCNKIFSTGFFFTIFAELFVSESSIDMCNFCNKMYIIRCQTRVISKQTFFEKKKDQV